MNICPSCGKNPRSLLKELLGTDTFHCINCKSMLVRNSEKNPLVVSAINLLVLTPFIILLLKAEKAGRIAQGITMSICLASLSVILAIVILKFWRYKTGSIVEITESVSFKPTSFNQRIISFLKLGIIFVFGIVGILTWLKVCMCVANAL